jgi:hypothetical protein
VARGPGKKPQRYRGLGVSWQYILLAIVGSLLFAGGAAFSMMLG